MARKVLPDMAKLALTLLEKRVELGGVDADLAAPEVVGEAQVETRAAGRSGSELVSVWVAQPVRPGFLACSKS